MAAHEEDLMNFNHVLTNILRLPDNSPIHHAFAHCGIITMYNFTEMPINLDPGTSIP